MRDPAFPPLPSAAARDAMRRLETGEALTKSDRAAIRQAAHDAVGWLKANKPAEFKLLVEVLTSLKGELR